MQEWGPENATCLVFTYKDGILAKMAHDLKLKVTRFTITPEGTRVRASFSPGSLEVVCARKDGRDDASALSEKDRREIERTIRDRVLEPARFGEIRLDADVSSTGPETWRLEGTLTLHGVSRPLSAPVRREGDELVAEVRILQPDFGIVPFKAAFGALKVKPEVRVELRARRA